ncbi:MAG: hypothetical protein GW827_03260 [Flavobacteriales bacterium]|nr:hypothetical protein [Flavobacteriales bacterium]PIY12301.1 MAG: hypothetical protein COZ17_04000 [Flavobacteriaceae bacterium CG_4_10_14_3_um_filter_33_47]PJB19527.1 MAG: hypothetical protein CO117_04260 [Flavobacteriaceae bacterium CG_4_9_14_3_um_filter_33_16]NCP89272.1 hypothetical protein [Flavobacteriales bacterium]NCQ13284.1 hypothetical protein [Flavobacteriales bacterium]
MKTHIFLCSILMLLVSCKDPATKEKEGLKTTSISSAIENAQEAAATNASQDRESEKATYKALKKKTPLTNDQLFAVLPKHINGNKPVSNYVLQVSSPLASGVYGPLGKKSYNFFIQDGVGSSAVVRNFFDSYKIKNQGPPKTEYIYLERDGYKTIAFLQPEIKRNEIRFVYNNRFRITLEGPDSADVLWSYIDFENLKKLDQYQ